MQKQSNINKHEQRIEQKKTQTEKKKITNILKKY